MLYSCDLMRILRTDLGHERAAVHASDDFIRTNSHTRFEREISTKASDLN
jgi:hypothetical protein